MSSPKSRISTAVATAELWRHQTFDLDERRIAQAFLDEHSLARCAAGHAPVRRATPWLRRRDSSPR